MAGLDDINPTDPAGNETPTLGDNRIRALAAKTIEAFGIEHALAGEHTFLVGSAAQRPAAGHEGRFFILTAAGVAVELQYDTGSAWVNITSNQTTSGQSEGLAAHIAANPIDHPDDSVTSAKILAGNILAKHLDAASGNASIAALVDGSNADAFHTHASTDQNIAKFTSSATWTCPAGITLVEFEGWGGGGGGGYGNNSSRYCGGGGGGGYARCFQVVVPGTDYTVTVGLGGTGGTGSSHWAGDGGNTSFESIYAYGGQGGYFDYNNGTRVNGKGGTRSCGRGCDGNSGGDITFKGAYDDYGVYLGRIPAIVNTLEICLGGRAGGCGGLGGGRDTEARGEAGVVPGGGGSGGDISSSIIGGNGANGFAQLKW